MPNLTPKFRHALKGELQDWLEQGLLTAEAAQRLRALYRLDELGHESSRKLAAVIFTIGGLLVGGGVISFVAANWEVIPASLKIALLFAILLGFHLTGYWLRYQRNSPRLGHALLFCGCLVFGANIGLLAQIFHLSGDWYRAYAAWAIGSLALAWAVRSWLIGVLALSLSFIWFAGFANDYHERLATIYPFLLALTFVPLGWVTRSRVLYTLTYAALSGALVTLAFVSSDSGRAALLALVAGGFIAWTAGEFHRVTCYRPEFGNALALFGAVLIAVCAYAGSFHEWWGHNVPLQLLPKVLWLAPATAACLTGLLLGARAWQQMTGEQRVLFAGLLSACLLVIAGILLSGKRVALPVLLANLAALIVAAIGIRKGFLEERRSAFWAGTLFLTLLVLTRFLEYETSLLLKSLAFIVCGVLTIAAGSAYERQLRRKEVAA